MKGHLHDRPRSTLVPPIAHADRRTQPFELENGRNGPLQLNELQGESLAEAPLMPEGGRDDLGSHLVQRNKPIPSASEAGICPRMASPSSLN
jgi:hypothetical protein